MVTIRDYPAKETLAARAVLLELAHLLGQYRQDVVLVGGWVPELLFPDAELVHIGSLDVDLAKNAQSGSATPSSACTILYRGSAWHER
jgi:hypothetical protein